MKTCYCCESRAEGRPGDGAHDCSTLYCPDCLLCTTHCVCPRPTGLPFAAASPLWALPYEHDELNEGPARPPAA